MNHKLNKLDIVQCNIISVKKLKMAIRSINDNFVYLKKFDLIFQRKILKTTVNTPKKFQLFL